MSFFEKIEFKPLR